MQVTPVNQPTRPVIPNAPLRPITRSQTRNYARKLDLSHEVETDIELENTLAILSKKEYPGIGARVLYGQRKCILEERHGMFVVLREEKSGFLLHRMIEPFSLQII